MIKNLGALAKIIGKEENELKEAMSSEQEVEIELPQGEFYTPAKLTELKNNITEEIGKSKYIEGKDAGREMFISDLKEHFKLDYEGKKDVEQFKTKLGEKVLADAKIEPNKKYKDYEDSIVNLQKQIKKLEEDKDTVIKDKESKINKLETNFHIRKNIKGKLKGVNEDQVSLLFLNEHQVSKDEQGKILVSKEGKVLKDNMENPLSIETILNQFITDNNWYEKDGRGGGDQNVGGVGSFKNMSEVFKHLKSNNIDPLSEQGIKIIGEAKQQGLEFSAPK